MDKREILRQLKGGLIVSCQALENEPLHSSFIMGRMAKAAEEGGAVGIRANTVEDIIEIKNNVKLPVIGIIKREYNNYPVYITPTFKEVDELYEVGVEIIATDATFQPRPKGLEVGQFIRNIKERYPKILVMADISTYNEGIYAQKNGADIIATTMSGYTSYTKNTKGPNFQLVKQLIRDINVPLIVEGKINTPEEAKKCIELGAWAVVVGGAITRPHLITKKFVKKIEEIRECKE